MTSNIIGTIVAIISMIVTIIGLIIGYFSLKKQIKSGNENTERQIKGFADTLEKQYRLEQQENEAQKPLQRMNNAIMLVKNLHEAIKLFLKTQDGDKDKTTLKIYNAIYECIIFFDENKDLNPKFFFAWDTNIVEKVGKKEIGSLSSMYKDFEQWIKELETKKSEIEKLLNPV